MNLILGLFQICRPLNAAITGLVVIVGGYLAQRYIGTDIVYLISAAISAGMVAAGGNAINDAYDLDIDSINRPERPIPAGLVSQQSAGVFGVLMLVGGVLLGLSTRADLGAIALVVALLLWAYSARLKRMPLLGNLVVAVCGGLAFLYGAAAVSHWIEGLIPAGFAVLIHLAREIIKDIEDIPGDKQVNARTLPIVHGVETALMVSAATMTLLALATPLPYLFAGYSLNYLIAITVGVAIPLLAAATVLMRDTTELTISRMSAFLKVEMLVGLGALFIG